MNASGPPENLEYKTWHDPWILRCARSLLSGLTSRQDKGGIEVITFSVDAEHSLIEVIVMFDLHESLGARRVGFRVDVENLRRMFPSDDGSKAGLVYLEDMAIAPQRAVEARLGETTWFTLPPSRA